MLVAPRGFGKTWFAMSLADAVSQEKDFGLWKTETAVDTLYLEGEMAARDVQERFKSLCADSKRARKLIIYSEGFANSMGYPRASLLDQAWRKRMADFLLRQGVKFWVVDNLSSLTPGIDENSKQDFDPVNQWFLNLRFQGISSLVLHHTGKNQDQRGTSGREDNVDYSIILQRPSGYLPEEGAKFIVHFTKARVEHKHLAGISDTEFSMVQDAEGRTRWSFTKIKPSNTKEVIRMLSEGVPYRDVTSALGVSLGVVTKIKKQAIKDRYLTHDGKLTQAGFIFISQ
jgi:putative DNA primase/helicase